MLEMFSFITKVKAQSSGSLPNITDVIPPTSNFGSIEEIVFGALNWIFILGGGLAVIGIVYSGIMYITAGGDTTKAEGAKKNLIWSVIGLIVMFLANIIIDWVQAIITTNATF